MDGPTAPHRLSDDERTALRPLARQFPTLDAALAEVARLSAELTLPMGTVHVLSDIHGEDAKLRHVINNASGMLRPLVKRMFGSRLDQAELQQFLGLLFYPREALENLASQLTDRAFRETFCSDTLGRLFEIVHYLARRFSLRQASRTFPPDYRELFLELLRDTGGERGPRYYEALIEPLVRQERALHLIRLTVRVVRNLAVDELIIGGDCWDRGPRGDRVVDYLMRQPRLAFTWGNHDAAWLGACLGNRALIAHVLRISLRYQRLAQLEEGYGLPLAPLEELARTVYRDDPAVCFAPKGGPGSAGVGRDRTLLARMQKAAAVMQFKLEGEMFGRNPHWGLEGRRLLEGVDPVAGVVAIEGKTYPLRDAFFPTLDRAAPYTLHPAEAACMNALRESFRSSARLWQHMAFLLSHGSMYLQRDDNLIFHGCVPVDERGGFLTMPVDGRRLAGRALFDALDEVLARILDRGMSGTPDGSPATEQADRDLMWYLWCGPRSPLFGKDKIATFEIDLVADPATHVETKNPYFHLIHEVPFCERILAEFGADPGRGMIVNGHVPVKLEKGESPLKRSGKAITIDGAFSEAYGDHGFSLVLDPEQTLLATHHHFDSAERAVREGMDIIPAVSVLRQWDPPRRVGDTERGAALRRNIAQLERLAHAYRTRQLWAED